MAAKKIFDDEELVDLFCQYLVHSFRKHASTGAGLNTKERTSLINELVEYTGKSCTNVFKTKITMLGERVFEYILSEPNLKILFYDSLIQKEPDNLELVLEEFQLFVFRGLKEEDLIEGNSSAFKGSELGDELEEMILNGEQLAAEGGDKGGEQEVTNYEERLKELKRLFKKGLISEVVYEEKQREILADY